MLTSLALAMAGGQPVGASSADGRAPASDSTSLADGGPTGGQGGPAGGERAGGPVSGPASDGDPPGSDGGVVPAASASPSYSSGGSAGGPPDDWHHYHHWTDPSWPDPGQATGERIEPDDGWPRAGAPLPARTAGGYSWEPPVTPTIDPSPSTGWTPTPGDPTDPTDPAPGTPTGSATTTAPAPDPAGPDDRPDTPTPPDSTGSPGGDGPDGTNGPGTGAMPTGDPLPRDPLAAGPDDDLGLGETVEQPTPTPEPTPTRDTSVVPARAGTTDTTPAGEYRHTLIYSGMIGLALAAIGLTMVGLRRRRW